MHFTKMHGLGNDYLYVYDEVPADIVELSIKLSDRHTGVGSDGMIYICHSDIADFKMRIFNADGSEAKMCGNGVRCVGKYVYDKGYTDKKEVEIETLSGIKTLKLTTDANNKVEQVTVGMGKSEVSEDMSVTVDGVTYTLVPVSVGNPHVVIFVDDIEKAPLTTTGPKIEKHELFPDGVNVEFVQVLSDNSLRMRVWERGSGVTMACGTGACASVSAAVSKGYCKAGDDVSVTLDGGVLTISVDAEHNVIMTGPAATVCEGDVE